jgi:polyferredoxin
MEKQQENILKRLTIPIILFVIFWTIAFVLWQLLDNIFFIFNFGYIGTAVALGIGAYDLLPRKKKPTARRLAQLLVGSYLLGYLGFFNYKNLQIEGFFFYLLGGVIGGSLIHYLVAKVFIPVIIGRGWCGWSCWTTMVLDYLPYKKCNAGRLSSGWEKVRYYHFGISLSLVLVLWFLYDYRLENNRWDGLIWLIIGNVFYFGSGIILAFILKDNRAFCKYICPITVVLKITSRFALLKIEGDKNRCNDCKACTRACPMDIKLPEYIKNNERIFSTECVLCQTCMTVCPQKALSITFKCDMGGKDLLRRRKGIK